MTDLFTSDTILVTLRTELSNTPRVLDVSFQIRTSEGEPVATYRTNGAIHPLASRRLLGYLAEEAPSEHPDRVAEKIHYILTYNSRIQFDVEPARSASAETRETGLVKVFPAVPRLEDVIKNPSLVDNQYTAVWTREDQVIRVFARLDPLSGFAVATIDISDSHDKDETRQYFKIIAPPDPTLNEAQIRTLLLGHIRIMFSETYMYGREGALSYVEGAENVCFQAGPNTLAERQHLDLQIKNGVNKELHEFDRFLDSGAGLSLTIGCQIASIVVAPCPHKSLYRYIIKFECPSDTAEFTSWQIHYIRKAYQLLTSDTPSVREEGALMCNAIRENFLDLTSAGPTSAMKGNLSSYRNLTISRHIQGLSMEDMLGDDQAAFIQSIPGIIVDGNSSWFPTFVVDLLAGAQTLTVTRNSSGSALDQLECIDFMRLSVFNDQAIRVYLENGVGSKLVRLIPRPATLDYNAADIVTSLIDAFASDSWDVLLEQVNQLTRDLSRDIKEDERCAPHNDFPPCDDVTGLRMFGEAIRMYSWLVSGFGDSCKVSVRHSGPGAATFEVEGGFPRLRLRFLLVDGVMQDICISESDSHSHKKRSEPRILTRFFSNDLSTNSAEAREILDCCSLALYDSLLSRYNSSSNRGLSPAYKTALEKLALHMTRY